MINEKKASTTNSTVNVMKETKANTEKDVGKDAKYHVGNQQGAAVIVYLILRQNNDNLRSRYF